MKRNSRRLRATSRRCNSNNSNNNSKLPRWASWRERAPLTETEKYDNELDRTKEDLWLRLQAFRYATHVVLEALGECMNENCNVVRDTSNLLRHCGQKGFAEDSSYYDETETNGVVVLATTTRRALTVMPSSSSCCSMKFLIEEKEPSYSSALPIVFIEAPLEERDRELWMHHICRELCRANTQNEEEETDADQPSVKHTRPAGSESAEQPRNERRQVLIFESVEDLDEYRCAQGDVTTQSAIYIVKTVRSARRFANCIHGMSTAAAESSNPRPICSCLVVFRPPCLLLDEERWSTDVYTKISFLPPTERVIATFWQRMSSKDFPMAVAQDCDTTASSISATIDHVRRSMANILARKGSFWAAMPILPTSLIRRARSIHDRHSIVHMLPAIGCVPSEWNETTKKVLIERLVNRYKALPHDVQEAARDSLFRSVLWLDRLTSRQQLVRLVFPNHDGDHAQPRRETVRALMETSIGGQLKEGTEMDAYVMRHLAVCGMGRIIKNGTFEKRTHVWCAGE